MSAPPQVTVHDSADSAEEAFYEALQRGDVEGVMALWADDDEVVCTHPGGPRLVGLERIRESWTEILAEGGLDVRPGNVRVYGAGTLSVHSLIERIVVVGARGRDIAECVATNVYTRTAAGWRLLAHHAGASPGGEEPAPPSSGGATLH
ncbi:MAG TPA: nuclear transport factor 2 family protein [Burkholderiaceae bacterium]|nr:nuclear transport factor 2 family protein [Burkholderiaceae bacterium]